MSDRTHAERPSAYWAWRDRLAADPTCWKFTDREDAIAFAAFIAGWHLRTGENPYALPSPNAEVCQPEGEKPAERTACQWCNDSGYETEDHGHYPCRTGCLPNVPVEARQKRS